MRSARKDARDSDSFQFWSGIRVVVAIGTLLPVSIMAQERPAHILQIFREPLKPGSEPAYTALEKNTAHYRSDSSTSGAWKLAGARFIVIAVTHRNPQADGVVFEAPDGVRFILRPVGTRQQAEAEAAASGAESRVFAVRPYWGLPAKEWIAADPEFWKSNPMTGKSARD